MMHSQTIFHAIFKRILCCIALLGFGMTHAQTSYVHDANGRVVAVTQSNGTTTQYSYDALGHVGPVTSPLSVGQLAIFAFMPTHGVASAEVTLEGQGFSSIAASDSVSFNGTAATLLSASATQLAVSVSNGATTGPITVTVAGQTATSATPFVMDDTGAPPTMTQVSPLVVAVGSTVTVTGTHLDPVAGGTTVPSNGVSGLDTVNTPYGSATSAVPVAVLPSNVVSELNGAPTSYLPTNGTATSFSTGAAGKSDVLTFDAPQGGNDEFTLSGMTINGSSATQINVNIYGPGGAVVSSGVCYTSNPGDICRIGASNLVPGIYAAVG